MQITIQSRYGTFSAQCGNTRESANSKILEMLSGYPADMVVDVFMSSESAMENVCGVKVSGIRKGAQ